MKEIFLQVEKAAHHQRQKSLPPQQRKEFDPSNVTLPEIDHDSKCIKYIFWAPRTTKIEQLPPLYICDAAHMIGVPGTMFSAWSYSANGNACCVAAGFHLLNEAAKSWKDFLGFIVTVYPQIDSPRSVLIADGDKGCDSAVAALFRETQFLCCGMHRRESIKAKTNRQALYYWDLLAGCKDNHKYENTLFEMLEKLADEDIKKIFNVYAKNQFLLKAVEASKSITFGYYTTQLVESMNQSHKPARQSHFVPAMMKLLHKEKTRYNDHKQRLRGALNEGYELTPAAHDILTRLRREAEKLASNVTEGAREEIFVETTNGAQTVNLQAKTCSCGVPGTDGQPCVHVLCAASQHNVPDVSLFAHDYLTTSRWLQQYPEEENLDVVTFPGLREYVKKHGYTSPDDGNLQVPLMGPPPKGRPAKRTRIQGASEKAKKKTKCCRLCKRMGHNIRACPKRRA
jgi:hypothetical protein